LFKIIPDYGGAIKKLLWVGWPVYRQDKKQYKTGLIKNFLEKIKKTGVCPEVYALIKYSTEDEKKLLTEEVNEWNNLVKSLECVYFKSDMVIHAQDVCTVLDSDSVIFSSLTDPFDLSDFGSLIKDLLSKKRFRVITPKVEYSLEGGYICATQNYVFFSNPKDNQIMANCAQTKIFVEDFLENTSYKLIKLLWPDLWHLVRMYTPPRPAHVDLILSAFEKEDYLGIFYSNYAETLSSLLSKINNDFSKWRLNRIIRNVEQIQKEILQKIEKSIKKKVVFYEMPGIIGFKSKEGYHPCYENGTLRFSTVKLPIPYLYSGTNLLFHSIKGVDYAFYLKYPQDLTEKIGFEVNRKIKHALKEAGFIPVPISGTPEESNYASIYGSAGMRCLVKILSRS